MNLTRGARIVASLAVVAVGATLGYFNCSRGSQTSSTIVPIRFPTNAPSYSIKDTPSEASPVVSPGQEERARATLNRALQKYPDKLLQRAVSAVNVFGDLRIYGVRVGGTYDPGTRAVYIVSGPTVPDYGLEYTLHHEISSLLLLAFRPRFRLQAWLPLTDPTLHANHEESIEAIRNKAVSLDYDEKLMARGFVNSYSTTAPEEDFSCIAAELFSGNPRFWKAVDKYRALRTKVREAVNYYGSLDRLFTENYFRALARR